MPPHQPTKEEIEARLEELKWEYDLAKAGLRKAQFTIIAFIGLMVYAVYMLSRSQTWLSGTHVTILGVVLIFAYVIYFSFVFGRVAKLKAEVSKNRKLLEMSAGDKVR